MLTYLMVAAVVVIAVLLVFLLRRRDEAELERSSPQPDTGHIPGAPPPGPGRIHGATHPDVNGGATSDDGGKARVDQARVDPAPRRTEEEGGTKLASDPPPPPKSPATLASASTEIDLSDPSLGLVEDDPTGPTPRILVTAVGQTDAGKRRKHNEDAYLVLETHGLFAIADGMGGYAAGEVASQLAIDVLATSFKRGQFAGEPIEGLPRRGDELVRAIQAANATILSQARANEAQAGMGTTLVAARFSPSKKRVYIAHVGDSRLYRLRRGELVQLTTDHTLGAMGIKGPSASKLSRAVGVFDQVEVDLTIDDAEIGDYYLLCSDGLSKMVPEPAIGELITTSEDLDEVVAKLIGEANDRGGKDNVSVILIRVDEPFAR